MACAETDSHRGSGGGSECPSSPLLRSLRPQTLRAPGPADAVLVLVATVVAGLAIAGSEPDPPPNPRPLTLETPGGLPLHVVQTGWVAVKRRFRELSGPASLRALAIVLDRDWTEWMPILFYVLEHDEGIVVFDTGETARVSDPDYFSCDAATGWFYRSQLRFAVRPEDELGPQLEALGLDAASVRWAVLSHLHSDHMGGMRHLTGAEFLISRRDWAGHRGALRCRIPEFVRPTLVEWRDPAFGAFASSHRVTSDGALRIVPTPGHTPGHQSLLLREGDVFTLFACDVVFDQARLDSGRGMAGIVEEVAPARASLETVSRQLRDFETRLAPAHDPGVGAERFGHVHASPPARELESSPGAGSSRK